MLKSELFAFVKSDSMKKFVPASEVRTHELMDILNGGEYNIGFTYDELQTVFPEKVAENLCYNNGFDKAFYCDREKLILFPVHLYGQAAIKPLDELGKEILERAEALEESVGRGDYYPSLMVLNDKMRMEMLNLLVEKDRITDGYTLFKDFYQTSDYGCSELTLNTIRKLCAMKTEEHQVKTDELIQDLPNTVTVYRGEGDRSAKWQDAVSWTTDINVANFFASRMPGRKARILTAEVAKKDIVDFFETESECIILPENITLKQEIKIYGLNLLDDILPYVRDKYAEYRDMMLDELEFNIDDNEHGRLHTLRVLLNALIIANLKELPEEDIDKLCTAAIFHDTMRKHNGEDDNHGRDSAEYYRKFTEEFVSSAQYSKTVENLITYHCLPDDIGKSSMPESDWHLFDIIKDADGLDRLRFGIHDLDINQLRTPEAKSLTMVALINIEGIKIPEPKIDQGMEMM